MNASIASLRATLLSSEELARLMRPRTGRVFFHIAVHWALILASWALVAHHPTPPIVALAIVVIGIQANGLLIIAHDGIHRSITAPVARNDAIVDWLVFGAVGAITRIHRANHIEHHRKLCTLADPDRPNYVHDTRPDRLRFLLFFTGALAAVRTVRNVFRGGVSRAGPPGYRRYRAREVLLVVGWQLALIAGLSVWIGWWAYPLLWLLPLYLFYFLADIARSFAEHSDLVPDDVADERGRLYTFVSNPIERLILAPHNMNLHAVHHLWPTIPYPSLPEADRLVRERLGDRKTPLEWRGSYLAYFSRYFGAMPLPRTRATT